MRAARPHRKIIDDEVAAVEHSFRTGLLALLRWRWPPWAGWLLAGGALAVALLVIGVALPPVARRLGGCDAGTLGALPVAAAVTVTGLCGQWRPIGAVTLVGLGVVAAHVPAQGRAAALVLAAVPVACALAAAAALALLRYTRARLEAERSHAAALIENHGLLFRELQHRVANNMQFISSLLTLQSRRVPEEARRVLVDARQRVDVLSRIHRRLTTPVSSDDDLGQMVEETCRDLLEATGASNIVCRVNMAPTRLPLDAISALSLIITELITNALKHAFVGRSGGTIAVSLQPLDTGRYILEVRDDGVGLATAETPARHSLGMRVIEALARRLDGTFSLTGDPAAELGTVARLEFGVAVA